MPLNVPDNSEDVTDLENQNNPVTVGAYSVPLNGAPKVKFILFAHMFLSYLVSKGSKIKNEVQEPSYTRSTMYAVSLKSISLPLYIFLSILP